MPAALPFISCCEGCECATSEAITPPASGLGSFVIVENVEDARGVNPDVLELPALLHTLGGDTPGDTFGKIFRWVPDSFAVDDGTPYTINIQPSNRADVDAGRWEQTSLV